MIPARMSGVQLIALSGPEVLRRSDAIPVPVPGSGEALERVPAAGAAGPDRADNPLPKTFGVVIDLVGGADFPSRLIALRPGGVRPLVSKTCPMRQIAEAQADLRAWR